MPEYINIAKEDISTPIYRIISFEQLVRLFNTKLFTLVNPMKWDDPFENIISKTHIKIDNKVIDFGIRNDVYGNCWTKRSVSDAIWRIYSADKKSVRIKSTPEIIMRNVLVGLGESSKSNLYIGKVDYVTTAQIKQKAKDYTKRIMSGDIDVATAESLLFKRNSFSHEDEVRVIIIDHDKVGVNSVLSVSVDPHDLIQSVVIDSRAFPETIDIYKKYLETSLNFKGGISKSTLYDMPKPITIKYKIKKKIKQIVKRKINLRNNENG